MDTSLHMTRLRLEDAQQWREEIQDIPFIQFPADWQIQVIPPFGDAVVRFRVRLPSGKEKSIYLDKRNSLGYWHDVNKAYWEVYPHQGDVGRCNMNEINLLLEMIGDET
jgi:hypothetical protein